MALRMVNQVARTVKIPVIGMGGIMNSEDALEFLMAGAAAIAVGTANFRNPTATVEVIDGISKFLEQQGIPAVKEIIGCLNK